MRIFSLAAALLALSIGMFCAPLQDAGAKPTLRPEIRGVVLEPGTSQPVVDAEISLYFLGEDQPKIRVSLGMLTSSSIARSDFAGAFAFRLEKLGYYAVAAKKETYSAPATAPSSANLTLTAEEPTKEVRLFLARPGQLTGHVVDDETDKPLFGVRVTAGRAENFAGHRMFSGPSGTTDRDGHFAVSNLTPGEYVAIIRPQKQGKGRIIANFSEKDLEAVDQDFDLSYWPGGHGEEAAIPVLLGSGPTVTVGEVRVKRRPYYRVHVRIPAASCGSGDTMQVYDEMGGSGMGGIAPDAPCGKDMLIAGFLPGAHRLVLANNAGRRGTRAMASVPFTIGDKNIEIAAPMTTGITVDAKFVAAEGAKPPDFTEVGLALYPVGMLPFTDLVSPQSLDSVGRITLVGVPMVRHRIMFSGLDAGHYVKEIRYNGSPISEDNLPLDKGAMSYSLTVVIDDKPAIIAGSVVKDDKPVSQPYLVLVKWPPSADWPIQYRSATGDDKGRFQFVGLVPGEYRLVALASSDEDVNRTPGVLERALAKAKKIEAGPRALLNITIELSELR